MYREVLSDVFDLPALRDVLGGVASREIAVHRVETLRASPFASARAARDREPATSRTEESAPVVDNSNGHDRSAVRTRARSRATSPR